MSGGVNLKPVSMMSRSRSTGGGSPSLPQLSSLPLPSSSVSPKMDAGRQQQQQQQQQYTPLPAHLAAQLQRARSRSFYGSPPSSASTTPSAVDVLQRAALKNQLLQEQQQQHKVVPPAAGKAVGGGGGGGGGGGAGRSQRAMGTRSAYSSPQVPKREVPRTKDTLDLRGGSLLQKTLRGEDLQTRRNTNQNWTFGKYRLRSVDNADSGDPSAVSRGVLAQSLLPPQSRAGNGNETAPGGRRHSHKESGNPLSNQTGAVNMAAVAPFRFSRLQVTEETDPSLDELSDCSSDSMEVCCEDLGEDHTCANI